MDGVDRAYDLRIVKGSTSVLYGPTASGKTYRVANILREKDKIIKEGSSIKNVVFCYSAWQPIYDQLKKERVVTRWINYMPSTAQFVELVQAYKDAGGSIVCIDDFMTEISKDLVEIVCVKARHYNATVFMLFQSLFPSNPLARQISLNAKYLYIHKNPRENAQISYIARQISPANYKWIVYAYYDATNMPYGYLLIDLTQETPEHLRFRSNILPHEFPMVVYQPPKI